MVRTLVREEMPYQNKFSKSGLWNVDIHLSFTISRMRKVANQPHISAPQKRPYCLLHSPFQAVESAEFGVCAQALQLYQT